MLKPWVSNEVDCELALIGGLYNDVNAEYQGVFVDHQGHINPDVEIWIEVVDRLEDLAAWDLEARQRAGLRV